MEPRGCNWGDNQRQIGRARKRREQAKTVAVRCDRLPREVHGKEGGLRLDSGKGLCRSPGATGLFQSNRLALFQVASGTEPFMEPRGRTRFFAPRYGALVAGSYLRSEGGPARPSEVHCFQLGGIVTLQGVGTISPP